MTLGPENGRKVVWNYVLKASCSNFQSFVFYFLQSDPESGFDKLNSCPYLDVSKNNWTAFPSFRLIVIFKKSTSMKQAQ